MITVLKGEGAGGYAQIIKILHEGGGGGLLGPPKVIT